jgi:hypothetical protein
MPTFRPLNGYESVIIGSIAGTISAILTNPLDVIKTRIMTGTISSRSPLVASSQIGQTEGICGLFFVVYEGTRNYIQSQDANAFIEVKSLL